MAADQLYPRITATEPPLKRDMVWQDLLHFGETGATPMELAARLLRDGKATGTVEGCAVRLMPLLEELVGMVGAEFLLLVAFGWILGSLFVAGGRSAPPWPPCASTRRQTQSTFSRGPAAHPTARSAPRSRRPA